VRRAQRSEKVDRKYVECLQTNMGAHYRRYDRQYKPPLKRRYIPTSPRSPVSRHTKNTEYFNQRNETRLEKYTQI